MSLTGTDRGTGNSTTGATSIACSPTSTIAQNSLGVLAIAYDNSGTSGADPYSGGSSFTDSVGNTWNNRNGITFDPDVADGGVCIRIFTSGMLVAALTSSDTVTISFSATVPCKAWAFHEVTGSVGTPTYVTGGSSTATLGAGIAMTTGSITNTDMVICAGGYESNSATTGDSDTTNGSWSTQQTDVANTGTSGTSIRVTSQRKVVSATATQSYNISLVADHAAAWIEVSEVIGTPTPNSLSLMGVGL